MIPGIFAGAANNAAVPIGPTILDDDPNYPFVTVLLQGNGAASGTVILDQVRGLWTRFGGVVTDGAGAISFDGSGDYATTTYAGAIGTGDFSVELKFRANSLASDGELMCISDSAQNLSNFNLVMEWKTTGAIRCSVQTGTSGGVNVDITSSTGAITTGVDYDLSFDIEGTTARIRLNGAVIGTGTITGTRANARDNVRIGRLSSGFPRDLNGKVYWARITAGVCRNPGSGTVTPQSDPPPDLPYPVFSSRWSAATTNDIQGIVTDGTHVWVSSSSTLYKYTTAGSLVTSRSVTGDAPVGKTQINGLALRGGVLYVSAAENSTPRKSWVVEYDPDALTYITDHSITGDWFSEGLEYRDGAWWIVFHADKVIAKVDPSSWAVLDTYALTWPITGSSGGFGGTQGYDGLAFLGPYAYMNIHEIYDQDLCDIYAFDGTDFLKISRIGRPTANASQGICFDPSDATVMWFAERSAGGDSVARCILT